MDGTTRRRLLGTAGTGAVAGLAGCGGISLPFTGSDHEDPEADGRQYVVDMRDDVKTAPLDGHAAWDFEADEFMQIEVSIDVQSSYSVDFIITNEKGYQNYLDGNSFEIFRTESAFDTKRFNSKFQTGPGHYYVIVDNTSVGGTAPPDNADELDAPEATARLVVFT